MKMKIFGSDGKMIILSAADKIEVDGESYSDMGKAKNALINSQTGKVDVQIITYSTNENNEIKAIDTKTLGGKEDEN